MNRLLKNLSVAIALATLVCVALPVQSYLVNQQDFSYSLSSLLLELATYWVVVVIVGVVVLHLSKKGISVLLTSIVLSSVIYIYLETGILSHDYPMLDGDIFFFGDRVRAIWDFSVYLVLCAIFLMLRNQCYEYRHFIAGSVLLLVVASLFDVKVTKKSFSDNDSLLFRTPYATDQVLDSAVFSTKTNTIILVLDSMTTELAVDVFREYPELKNNFSGFTHYTNNIGMHRCTDWGLPGLVTGRYMERSRDYTDYMKSAVSTNSIFAKSVTAKIPTFILAKGSISYNWTNLSTVDKVSKSNKINRCPTTVRLAGQQEWNLREIIGFRMLPFGLKRKFFFHVVENWPNEKKSNSEDVLYPKLASRPIRDDVTSSFHFYHTQGAHGPYITDREGKRLSMARTDYSGALDKACYVFKQVSELLRNFKERGIYDNSFIVITADHGADASRLTTLKREGYSLPAARAFPLLMVKPRRARKLDKIQYSNIPSSHSKVFSLLSANLIDDANDVDSLLITNNRFFRDFRTKDHETINCRFDAEGVFDKVQIVSETY